MNTFVAVFCVGSYRVADEFFAVLLTSVVVATVAGICAMVIACILLFPTIGRWCDSRFFQLP